MGKPYFTHLTIKPGLFLVDYVRNPIPVFKRVRWPPNSGLVSDCTLNLKTSTENVTWDPSSFCEMCSTLCRLCTCCICRSLYRAGTLSEHFPFLSYSLIVHTLLLCTRRCKYRVSTYTSILHTLAHDISRLH